MHRKALLRIPKPIFPFLRTQSRGAALLIALAFLVLLSAVVLALFGTTRTDRQNASTFATGQETLRLADAAVNLVQGQIRDATIQPRVGWASQPGMIRTFGTSGNATTAYKLYSSDEMVVSNFGKSQIDAETTAMSTWNLGANATSYNALYCDLNSPAAVRRPQPGDESQTEDALVFPIADPAAIGAVEGFSANTSVAGTVLGNATTRRLPMPVKWIYVLRDGQMTAPTSGDASKVNFSGSVVPTQSNPIVGRIAFWADDETCKLNINTASEGIFWDTPKTASWQDLRLAISIPVQGEFQRLAGHPATTSLSPVFGSILPRPQTPFISTTAGSSASGFSDFSAMAGNNNSAGIDYYKSFAQYYNLTPRINWSTSSGVDHFNLGQLSASTDRSSRGGVQRVALTGRPEYNSEKIDPRAWPEADQDELRQGSPVIPDTDRLYTTVDELLFRPNRDFNNPLILPQDISRSSFFLTAQNRAPETTPFGTPRVSLWPINEDSVHQNLHDRLLNFCSTVGGSTYSFQRRIGNQSILSGTQPSDQLPDSSSAEINMPRNQSIISYLRNLTSTNIPGFGSSFSNKWTNAGNDSLIVQTYDYIRSNINADYISQGNVTYQYTTRSKPPTAKENFSGANTSIHDYSSGPRGTVTPSFLGSAKGTGRFHSFSEFTILFYATEIVNTYNGTINLGNSTWSGNETISGNTDGTISSNATGALPLLRDGTPAVRYDPPLPTGFLRLPTSHSPPPGNQTIPISPSSQQTTRIRAILLMQPYNPHSGRPFQTPSCSVEIEGFGALQAAGQFFGNNSSIVTNFGTYHSQGNGGNQLEWGLETPLSEVGTLWAFRWPANGQVWRKFPRNPWETAFTTDWSANYNPDYHYGFVSNEISVTGNTFSFSGGPLTVRIFPWSNRTNYAGLTPIQTINLNFPPAASLTTPSLKQTNGALARYPDQNAPNRTAFQFSEYDSAWLNGDNANWHFLSFWKRMRANRAQTPGESIARVVRPGDTAVSLTLSPNNPDTKGDYRILALKQEVPASFFELVNLGSSGGTFQSSLRAEGGSLNIYGKTDTQYGWIGGRLRYQIESIGSNTSLTGSSYSAHSAPYLSAGTTQATLSTGGLGDWQSGIGNIKDGAFFGREDMGDSGMTLGGFFESKAGSSNVAVGDNWEPNRIVPSAGVLAKLITSDSSGQPEPWQTILFTADPAAGLNHPGFGTGSSAGTGLPPKAPFTTLPDHLYLENFWMPVIEPYPVSEPLSTNGKVNLNYQMMPFSNIQRNTALRGALRPLLISGVPDSSVSGGQTYKNGKWVEGINLEIRQNVAFDSTLAEFQRRFDSGDVYRSSSEVSNVRLVPQNSGGTPIIPTTFWSARRATSDTLREQPYTALLSRVTTKSNTFTVHYRVQALRQPPRAGRNWAEWDEARDQVVGEYRGSTTIERFLDPNAQNIPDYTQVNLSSDYDPIDKFYRWRVLSQKQFAP